jgi:hypothetical protein
MTIPQFLKLQNGEISELDIRRINATKELDKELGYIGIDSKTFFKAMSLALAVILGNSINVLAAPKLDKVDTLGFTILQVIRKVGYWVVIIMASTEVIKSATVKDYKAIVSIIAKYATVYATLYMLPWLFDLIKETF